LRGARPLRKSAVIPLMWRSLRGLSRPLWIAHGPSLEVPGGLARVHLCGSCPACGPELVPGCRLALAGPGPGATHKNDLAARPPGRFRKPAKPGYRSPHEQSDRVVLATVLRSVLIPPAKTGGRSAVFPQKSGKTRRRERYFAPPGTSALPPEFLSRSVKCAAFDADLVAAPAPCRSGGGLEEGEAPPPIPTIRKAMGVKACDEPCRIPSLPAGGRPRRRAWRIPDGAGKRGGRSA